jgi:hypothetical protein
VATSIELRYAGVVIGKATVADPIDECGQSSLFVSVPDPLPVGTKVGIKVDDRTFDGRVMSVAESTDSAKCGMKIRIGGSATSASGAANGTAQSSSSSSDSSVAPPAPAPATEPAPIEGAVSAEGSADVSAAHGDGSSDGAPGGEEGGGQSGGQGGGKRRRRRR